MVVQTKSQFSPLKIRSSFPVFLRCLHSKYDHAGLAMVAIQAAVAQAVLRIAHSLSSWVKLGISAVVLLDFLILPVTRHSRLPRRQGRRIGPSAGFGYSMLRHGNQWWSCIKAFSYSTSRYSVSCGLRRGTVMPVLWHIFIALTPAPTTLIHHSRVGPALAVILKNSFGGHGNIKNSFGGHGKRNHRRNHDFGRCIMLMLLCE